MTMVGGALMACGIVMHGTGYLTDPESRSRYLINIATILALYVGLVVALTAQL